jgi:Zn-finger nucleic acid-binding protein
MLDEVMQGRIAYRQLVLRDNGERLRLPITAPINDLVGQLRSSAHEGYLPYLFDRYKAFGGQRGFLGDARERNVQEEFLTAAKSAVKGEVSTLIAPHLERLRFASDGSVDVPDFAALAAWSLLEAVRRQELKLFTCPICKGKWLGAPDGPKYCQRVAPGQVSKDCRTLAYEKRLAGDKEYRRYRREYKRLTEAFRRGSLDVKDLIAWRDENGPASFTPFDEWNANREED